MKNGTTDPKGKGHREREWGKKARGKLKLRFLRFGRNDMGGIRIYE